MPLQPGPPRASGSWHSGAPGAHASMPPRQHVPPKPQKHHHKAEARIPRRPTGRDWRARLEAVVLSYDALDRSLGGDDQGLADRFLASLEAARRLLGWEKPSMADSPTVSRPPWE